MQTREHRSLLVPIYASLAQLHSCRWSVSGLTRQQLMKPSVCCWWRDVLMNCCPNEAGERRVQAHKRPICRVTWQIVATGNGRRNLRAVVRRDCDVRRSSFKSLKCTCVKPRPPLRQAHRHRAALCTGLQCDFQSDKRLCCFVSPRVRSFITPRPDRSNNTSPKVGLIPVSSGRPFQIGCPHLYVSLFVPSLPTSRSLSRLLVALSW